MGVQNTWHFCRSRKVAAPGIIPSQVTRPLAGEVVEEFSFHGEVELITCIFQTIFESFLNSNAFLVFYTSLQCFS